MLSVTHRTLLQNGPQQVAPTSSLAELFAAPYRVQQCQLPAGPTQPISHLPCKWGKALLLKNLALVKSPILMSEKVIIATGNSGVLTLKTSSEYL